MINKKYDKEQNVLFVENSGRLDFETMKSYFSSFKNYSKYTKSLYILEDARAVNVKFSSEHLAQFSKTLSQIATKFNEVRHAVLLDEKMNFAYAMMINAGVPNSNYIMEVFSNEELALNWVKNR